VSSIGEEVDVLVPDVDLIMRLPFPEGGGLGSIGDAEGGGLSFTEL